MLALYATCAGGIESRPTTAAQSLTVVASGFVYLAMCQHTTARRAAPLIMP
jgi:hypothetical protein